MVVDVTSVIYNGTYIKEYEGLSTDTKPTLSSLQSGSVFFEIDTTSVFKWHVDVWVEL